MREKFEACIAEYNRLWEEVRKKWEIQQQLQNQLVYLIAAFVAASGLILSTGPTSLEPCVTNALSEACKDAKDSRTLFEWAKRVWLAAPILFSTLSILTAYHDRGIRQIAVYVYDWLRDQVEGVIEAGKGLEPQFDYHVWHWDGYWYPEFFRDRHGAPISQSPYVRGVSLAYDFLYSGAKYLLAFTASVIFLLLWLFLADEKIELAWAGFSLGWIIATIALFAGAFESWEYRQIRKVAGEHSRASQKTDGDVIPPTTISDAAV